MTLAVRSQIIKDTNGRIKFWLPSSKSREHYHIGIWIEGEQDELANIESVEYTLDESFKDNLRKSRNRMNKFGITIWTYGYFLILVKVNYANGNETQLRYNLTFDLPADDGSNYIKIV